MHYWVFGFFFRKEYILFSNVYISVNTIFKCCYLFFGWEIGHPLSTCTTEGTKGCHPKCVSNTNLVLVKTSKKHTCIKVANYKRLYSVVEAAEKIMNKWSDDADNEVHIFVLPPEKIDTLTVNEDIDEDKVDRQRLPNYICGNTEIQTNRADVDSANPYIDSSKESLSSSKADPPSKMFLMNQVTQMKKRKRSLLC